MLPLINLYSNVYELDMSLAQSKLNLNPKAIFFGYRLCPHHICKLCGSLWGQNGLFCIQNDK